MSVLYVMLISIGAPVLIILCALLIVVPLIMDTKARQAWKALPPGIYEAHRQRLFGLKPMIFWFAAAVIAESRDVFEWLKWNTTAQLAEYVSWVMIAVVLTYQFCWALRIVRSRLDLDIRLVRFARFALWGSCSGLLAVAGWGSTVLLPK